MTASIPRAGWRSAFLTALVGTLLASGCATTATKPAIWPPPPDEGRVRFIRSIHKEGDVESGLWRKVWRVLVPPAPSTIIRQPIALALSPDEKRLYVANGPRRTVIRVDLESGAFDLVADAEGHAVQRPMGVALDAEENLYVTDDATTTVLVFDRKGRYLREFGRDKLEEPRALAIDRKAQTIYVLNGTSRGSKAHRIDVFSLKGEHLRTIGKRGPGPGEFNYPSALTLSPDGRIFVADMLNFRVQVLDGEGNPIGAFGQIGAGQPGTFDKAKGIALDSFGNVYVTDSQQAFVQIFNGQFQPLMGFGGRGIEPGFLTVPGAIVIDSRNHIYVGDSATGKVSEYELFGVTGKDLVAPPDPKAPAGGTPTPTGEKAQDG